MRIKNIGIKRDKNSPEVILWTSQANIQALKTESAWSPIIECVH